VRCGPPACRRQHAAYNMRHAARVRHASRRPTACAQARKHAPRAVFRAAQQAGDGADGRACALRARGAGKPGTLRKARVLKSNPHVSTQSSQLCFVPNSKVSNFPAETSGASTKRTVCRYLEYLAGVLRVPFHNYSIRHVTTQSGPMSTQSTTCE
jgi:hypothetical protein